MSVPSHLIPSPFTARVPAELSEADWTDVAGQATPEWITGTEQEYEAFRNGVGLIDFSMLPKWEVHGPGAIDVMNRVFSRDLRRVNPGSIAYGVVTDEKGMMLDDSTVLVYSDERVRLTGGNWEVEKLIRASLTPETKLVELRDTMAVLSVQGPKSRETLQRLTESDLSNEAFPYYTFQTDIDLAGIPADINRMGFTAELGYEVMVPIDRAIDLWDAVIEAGKEFGAIGCGGGALMMVRVEAGMMMGDLEYDNETSPYECRLGWTVDLDKADFIGKEALIALKDRARHTVASVEIDGAPEVLEEARVEHEGDAAGGLTMAVPSPQLGGKTLALARLVKAAARVGETVEVIAEDGTRFAGRVVQTPVYDPKRERVRS